MSFLPSIPSFAKSEKGTLIISGIISFVFAVLIAPYVMLAIQGIAGFFAAVGVGLLGFKLAPWFGAWTSNLGMKLLRMEAATNPIPTLLNEQVEREKDLQREEEAAEELNNALAEYAAKQKQMAKDFPEDAKQFDEHLLAMRDLRDAQYEALAEGKKNLEQFKKEVRRADAIWKMTMVANSVSKTAGRLSQSDAIRKIQTETALDSVRASMAQSFSKLDHLARVRKGEEKLSGAKPELLAATNSGVFMPQGVTSKQAQPVQRG